MINVTKTYLPPLEEYVQYLEGIWERNWVTNNGPLVQELEAKLKEYLGVKHLFFVSNGTMALQIAIKALGLQGEIITTPFSYVATTSSIVWEGCQPVFVDIDPVMLCLDPDLIEAAITPRTTAILAVHVYGHPCDVERIQAVAEGHGLKVIYDAAHAFGVRYKGRSLLVHGDIATLSFHATKLFHTVEGGALVTNDDELAQRIAYMRNFGHTGPEDFWGLGVNGKNSEFHAAMGLCVLPRVYELIAKRRTISALYDTALAGSLLARPKRRLGTLYNYAYYPVVFASEEELLTISLALKAHQIIPRRYFYPSLNRLPYINSRLMQISEETAKRVLCLPLYHDLHETDVERISQLILNGRERQP
ncbi:MAG TPA: DegT/DnrJ/EryC1/StrS family aminotransferase [Anaerolineae bacterium]|nr:DegT/DnrJ/EryC1/StrS family aminotransferase [Anaerolineae bacterium]